MKKYEFYKKLTELLYEKARVAHVTDLKKYYQPESLVKKQNHYFRLASSLQNGTSSGIDRSIKFNGENQQVISGVLCDCDFEQVLTKFSKWEELYQEFGHLITDSGAESRQNRAEKAIEKGKYEDAERIKNRKTNWQKYSKGLFCGANFLKSEIGKEILDRMISYNYSEDIDFKCVKTDLKTISKEITGLGTALSCDWLKECGCIWLVKPDVHIKKIYHALMKAEGKKEIDYSKIKDIDVIEYYYKWAKELQNKGEDVTAYQLDKMIWLICTGEFYLDKNESIGRETIISEIEKIWS